MSVHIARFKFPEVTRRLSFRLVRSSFLSALMGLIPRKIESSGRLEATSTYIGCRDALLYYPRLPLSLTLHVRIDLSISVPQLLSSEYIIFVSVSPKVEHAYRIEANG